MGKLRELKISGERLTRRSDNTNRYFTEVERRPMLSPDEEFKVGLRAQKGDEEAINLLIESNLRFVISVAKQYSNGDISLDELVCQGNIGLIHAANTFDPSRGFKFISYAVWHIRKEILYYFTNYHKSIRVPQNILTALSQIRLIDQTIMQEEGRPGTEEEILEALEKTGKDFTLDQIKKYLGAEAKVSPLEYSDIEDANSPIDWLSSDSTAAELTEKSDEEIMLNEALYCLKPIEREIVILRHALRGGESESFNSIAEKYERSGEWARNVYKKAMRRLKAKLTPKKEDFEIN